MAGRVLASYSAWHSSRARLVNHSTMVRAVPQEVRVAIVAQSTCGRIISRRSRCYRYHSMQWRVADGDHGWLPPDAWLRSVMVSDTKTAPYPSVRCEARVSTACACFSVGSDCQREYVSNMPFISRYPTASSAKEKVPCLRISSPASSNARIAARHSALPTLTRLTPNARSSTRLN